MIKEQQYFLRCKNNMFWWVIFDLQVLKTSLTYFSKDHPSVFAPKYKEEDEYVSDIKPNKNTSYLYISMT